MAHDSVVILGGGGHACVVAEAATLAGHTVIGHIAPAASTYTMIGPWLGDDDALTKLVADGVVVALGIGTINAAAMARRTKIVGAVDPQALLSVIHPRACISPSAHLGTGVFVAAMAVVGTSASVGHGGIINTGAIVDHHTTVGPNTHIAPGARLGGGVTVGENTLVGSGAILRQGVNVGAHAVIGAGAVVVKDVASDATVIGNPARA